MLKFNKKLEFTDEEISQIRMALIGNKFYNDLESTKKCKMSMLPNKETTELTNKILQYYKSKEE